MRHAIISEFAILSLSLLSHAAVAQSGFYLFGTIGNSDADVALDVAGVLERRVDSDDDGFAFGVGYEFHENFSLEAGYQNFGNHAGTTKCTASICPIILIASEKVDTAALSMSLVASFRISGQLDGYGRLGLTSWELDGDLSSDFDESGEDLHYGAGVRWSFDDHWKIFGEYTRVDLDLDTVGIGIRYGF